MTDTLDQIEKIVTALEKHDKILAKKIKTLDKLCQSLSTSN